jgi:hypothetical protein
VTLGQTRHRPTRVVNQSDVDYSFIEPGRALARTVPILTEGGSIAANVRLKTSRLRTGYSVAHTIGGSRLDRSSAGGTGKLEPTLDDFNRLFLFTHLQPSYQNRAWIVPDGDPSGKQAVKKLTEKYTSWPKDHFRTWSANDFEYYFPEHFTSAVEEALSEIGKERRAAKGALLDEVKRYCDGEPEQAKESFEASASEVIDFLKKIEMTLFGGGA